MGADLTLLDLLQPGPGRVHRNGTATEHAAARAVAGRTGSQRAKVLAALVRAGGHGLTDYEASVVCGIARPHAAATRRKQLEEAGLVVRTARTRATDTGCQALVYVASVEGCRVAGLLGGEW